MRNPLIGLLPGVLNLLFPPRCVGCQREGTHLCSGCVAGAPRLQHPFCHLCAQPGSDTLCDRCKAEDRAIDGIRAPFLMQGAMREAVHQLKYSNLRALAPPMAELMMDPLRLAEWTPDLMVPVPLHRRRQRHRGYNQATLLAKALSRLFNIPVMEGALERLQDTPPQARSLSREERFTNVAGGFTCRADLEGRRVLLVDDVCTTGATLDSCARTLKRPVLWRCGASPLHGRRRP